MLTNFELFDLLEKLESRVNRYWAFYSVAVLAVTGWLFTGGKLEKQDAPWVVLGLFVFFAGNFMVISLTESRILAVEAEIQAKAQTAEILSDRFRQHLANLSWPYRRLASCITHWVVNAAVFILVFLKAK